MKKILTLLLILLCTFSIQAQGLKDKFFQQIGFSIYTDFYVDPIKEKTFQVTVYDNNYDLTEMNVTGNYRRSEYAGVSFYYTPRFNLIEKGSEKSYSISMPIGAHLSIGTQRFDGDYVVPNTTKTETFNYLAGYVGSLSLPIYFSYNTGMGATLASEKDNGFSIGLGIDTRISGLTDEEGNATTKTITMPKMSAMPSVLLGFRRWKNDKAKEIKIKLSYMPSSVQLKNSESSSFFNGGFAFALTFNRFLNF